MSEISHLPANEWSSKETHILLQLCNRMHFPSTTDDEPMKVQDIQAFEDLVTELKLYGFPKRHWRECKEKIDAMRNSYSDRIADVSQDTVDHLPLEHQDLLDLVFSEESEVVGDSEIGKIEGRDKYRRTLPRHPSNFWSVDEIELLLTLFEQTDIPRVTRAGQTGGLIDSLYKKLADSLAQRIGGVRRATHCRRKICQLQSLFMKRRQASLSCRSLRPLQYEHVLERVFGGDSCPQYTPSSSNQQRPSDPPLIIEDTQKESVFTNNHASDKSVFENATWSDGEIRDLKRIIHQCPNLKFGLNDTDGLNQLQAFDQLATALRSCGHPERYTHQLQEKLNELRCALPVGKPTSYPPAFSMLSAGLQREPAALTDGVIAAPLSGSCACHYTTGQPIVEPARYDQVQLVEAGVGSLECPSPAGQQPNLNNVTIAVKREVSCEDFIAPPNDQNVSLALSLAECSSTVDHTIPGVQTRSEVSKYVPPKPFKVGGRRRRRRVSLSLSYRRSVLGLMQWQQDKDRENVRMQREMNRQMLKMQQRMVEMQSQTFEQFKLANQLMVQLVGIMNRQNVAL